MVCTKIHVCVNSVRANKLRSASSVDDCVSWGFFIIRKKNKIMKYGFDTYHCPSSPGFISILKKNVEQIYDL